jgi:hypothetical protein
LVNEGKAVVTVLRNPCRQIDASAPDLAATLLGRDADGHLIRKSGIRAIVIRVAANCLGQKPRIPGNLRRGPNDISFPAR